MSERKTYFINKYNYGEGVVGFDEYVISLGTNCSLGCKYCYLKFSKTPQTPIIYQNFNKLEEELERLFLSKKEKIFYFNLGETTDSFLTKKHFETLIEISKIIDELAK
jgi:DNA repair photolyase